MDRLLPHDEIEQLDALPLEERAAALEEIERRLRARLNDEPTQG
jgi:hypothetical protein